MADEQMKVQAVPGYHPLTVRLIETLKHGKAGDEYTDEDMTVIIGKNTAVGGSGYHYLGSAIRHCEKHNAVVWRRVSKMKKIACLNAEEIVEYTHGDVDCIRRKARRGSRRLMGINPEQIPQGNRPHVNALAAQLGFIASISSANATKKIEGKTEQPKLTDALALFK